jgi:uncharacterized protein (DUF1015 family)
MTYFRNLDGKQTLGMAQFSPFAALRPLPDHVANVSCPPYDVLTTSQAKAIADPRPENLLHAILPEVDGNGSVDELSLRGAAFLDRLANNTAVMARDTDNHFYLYEQSQAGYTRMGFFGCVSVDDYNNGKIIRHELTRPPKVEERTSHILAQRAHAEPVMLAYRNNPALKALLKSAIIDAIPLYDFVDEQGVRHRLLMADPASNEAISSAFAPHNLYIADGHHRCEAASEAAKRIDAGAFGVTDQSYRQFPAVLLPDDELRILAYNRYLKGISDIHISRLREVLKLEPTVSANVPTTAGEIFVGTPDGWFKGILPQAEATAAVGFIDAEKLQQAVLEPIFGISDIRTDQRIAFSGGDMSISSMQVGLNDGTINLAFSLHPVTIQQLMDVSDAGELMPPKSTWFEPKLRSGLLIHTF